MSIIIFIMLLRYTKKNKKIIVHSIQKWNTVS